MEFYTYALIVLAILGYWGACRYFFTAAHGERSRKSQLRGSLTCMAVNTLIPYGLAAIHIADMGAPIIVLGSAYTLICLSQFGIMVIAPVPEQQTPAT